MTGIPPAALVGAGAWGGSAGLWLILAAGAHPAPGLAGGLLLAVLLLGPLLLAARGRPVVRTAAGPLVLGLAVGAVSCAGFWASTRPPDLVAAARAGEQVEVRGRVVAADRAPPDQIGQRPLLRVVLSGAVVATGRAELADGSSVSLLVPGHTGPVPLRGAVVQTTGRLLPPLLLREPAFAVQGQGAEVLAAPGPPLRAVAAVRERMWQAYRGTDPDAASLAAGLAIGDDSRQSAELADAMQASGLSHLLAVSGGNVAIVLALVVGLAALAGAPVRVRVGLGATAVVAYAWFVGPEPSVLRASVMGAVAVLGVLQGARGGGWPLLGSAVAVLVMVRPGLALAWGFALSVAATAGIIALAGPVARQLQARWSRGHGLAGAFAVTFAAQVATAPLVAAMSGTVPLAALPANLAAEVLVAPITVLGLLVAMAAAISVPAATLAAHLVEPPALLLAGIARTAAAAPMGNLPVRAGPPGFAVVAALVGAGAIMVRRARSRAWSLRRTAAGAASVAVVAAMLAGLQPSAVRVPRNWVVLACDIGQGDAFLVRVGPEQAVLVDTGPDAKALRACLQHAGIGRLAALLLTHFDTDHVAAVPMVLQHHRPGAVLVSPLHLPAANAADVLRRVRAAGVDLLPGAPGQQWRVGQARLRVLWPRRVIRAGSVSNNAAMATEVSVAGLRILFSGDLEPLGQAGLMASEPPGVFDVVTIPHHGSGNQHPAFLAWTGARAALVSAGRGNRFGHPHPRALALARDAGMVVGRTDAHGLVALVVRAGAPVLLPLGGRGLDGDQAPARSAGRATIRAWQRRRAARAAGAGAPGAGRRVRRRRAGPRARRSSMRPRCRHCWTPPGRAPPRCAWCWARRMRWRGW